MKGCHLFAQIKMDFPGFYYYDCFGVFCRLMDCPSKLEIDPGRAILIMSRGLVLELCIVVLKDFSVIMVLKPSVAKQNDLIHCVLES